MAELLPAAQAVLDAWESKLEPMVTCLTHDPEREALAAALETVADQVVPETPMLVEGGRTYEEAWTLAVQYAIRRQLLTIARELRGDTTTQESN